MRYSMLAYLAKMCRTLLEAAEYLDCAEKDSPVRAELLQNGRVMLGQVQTELGRHRADLRSNRPLEYLAAAEGAWETGGRELTGALEKLIACLPEEVHYQVRAVFFTGLGSTWDAMESVWAAMRDDPRFDPVVVLIPIVRYKKGSEETSQEVIYEDYLTSLNVPFLGYTQYSLENDCPDLAFLNQPYEGNTITEFWPRTIAEHTRLVYLPYFLPEIVERETLGALCLLYVYQCAWKVVCSNEKEYRYYCRHALNGGENGLLTGIPKMDSIATIRERQIGLPEGWECLKGKKVFLWNTWYNINFSALRWFDEIIAWFSQHDDCALIWRPHPMSDTITKLYYPEEYPNYQKHIQQVESMPNAVYDRNVSFEAAFYYSDAMISDYSSLVPQYLFMDKPTLWIPDDIWEFTETEFIDSAWKEQTKNADGILDFLERSRRGEDPNAQLRKEIRAKDLPLADGHAGERLCGVLWQELHKEDFKMCEERKNG